MTLLLSIVAPSVAVATECPEAEAAWAALHEGVDPGDVTPEVRVIVGSMLARLDDVTAKNWLMVPEGHVDENIAFVTLARHHRSHDKLKSAVMAARTSLRGIPQDQHDMVVGDAALLLCADVYFEELARYPAAVGYYGLFEDSPFEAAGMARRSLIFAADGDAKGAKRALRSVRGWKASQEPDVIWARHMLGHTSREEALAELDAAQVRLATVGSVANAESLGGTARHVGLAPDLVAYECLANAHPDDDAFTAARDRALQKEVDWLRARVERARRGVQAGELPQPQPSLRQEVERLSQPQLDSMILLQDTDPDINEPLP